MSPIQDTSDMNMSNQWQTLTVEQAISYGKNLRNLKPRSSKEGYGYPSNGGPMRVFFPSEPCIKRRHITRKASSRSRKIKKYNVHKKKKRQTKCTLRIAALAIPSKRQCLHSWKNNSHILPAIMIERLQQMILDQKPMVLIKDAYGCFTKKTKKVKKRLKKVDHSGNKLGSGIGPNKNVRNLSSRFASEIYKKLMQPKNNTYCSTLQSYYEVVSHEINNIVRWRKKNKTITKMHDEITRKIAVWIATVLEETKCKILAEQLQELEEEEGPALDFLDDLMENVLDICAPRPKEEPYEFEKSVEKSHEDTQSSTISTTTTTTDQFVHNEVDKIIINVVGMDVWEEDEKNIRSDDEEISLNEPLHQDPSNDQLENVNFTDDTKHSSKDDLLEDNKQGNIGEDVQHDLVPVEKQDSNQQNNLEYDPHEEPPGNEHVSDIRITNNHDEDYVNYNLSETMNNEANLDENGDEEVTTGVQNSFPHSVTNNKQLAWAENNKNKFLIGSSSDQLNDIGTGNYMDEGWPHNIPVHSVKVTASAVVSIASLGTITELDETKPDISYASVDTSNTSVDSDITTSRKLANEYKKTVDSLIPKANKTEIEKDLDGLINQSEIITKGIVKQAADVTTHPEDTIYDDDLKLLSSQKSLQLLDETTRQTIQSDLTMVQRDPALINSDEILSQEKEYDPQKQIEPTYPKTQSVDKPLGDKDLTKVICKGAEDKTMGSNELAETEQNEKIIKDGMIGTTGNGNGTIHYERPEVQLDKTKSADYTKAGKSFLKPNNYIVNLETAPSWVRRKKEINKYVIKQADAKAWCKILLYTLDRLENLNCWLDKTARDMLHVEHRKELKRCCCKAREDIKSQEILPRINQIANIYLNMNNDLKWILLNRKYIYKKHREWQKKISASKNICCCNKFLRKSLQ